MSSIIKNNEKNPLLGNQAQVYHHPGVAHSSL